MTRRLIAITFVLTTAILFSTPARAQFTQQGSKLVGMGATGAAAQGFSVALSGDGTTTAVGGSGDSGNLGAVWIFTYGGGAWSQQGNKLIGSNPSGNSGQGGAVALSS